MRCVSSDIKHRIERFCIFCDFRKRTNVQLIGKRYCSLERSHQITPLGVGEKLQIGLRMSSSSVYATNRRQQTWSNQHQLRKQRSFVDSTAAANRILSQVSDSSRGGRRSGSLILAKQPSEKSKFSHLQKQRTLVDQVCVGIRGRSEQRTRGYSLIDAGGRGGGRRQISGKDTAAGSVKIAWTSNPFESSETIDLRGQSSQEVGSLLGGTRKDVSSRNFMCDRLKKSSSCVSSKSDNKINLSIVLSQTIKATENEVVNSDIESSSESADAVKTSIQQPIVRKSPPEVAYNKPISQQEARILSAAQRRAQFQSSRGEQISTSTATQPNPSNTIPVSASPSLTVQQRPPLVRAMSAPVRSLNDNTKNILANNKRKTRRRKIITRNSSCDKGDNDSVVGVPVIGPTGKKVLSRSQSAIAADVITLVSLISSEGSDSEKDDSTSIEENQTGRAPSLRKTGKSVSFQENEEPNYQMAVKEFPHMLRRGSIAPLAARLRSNRPPTAPPVSVFLSDYENCTVRMSELDKITKKDDLSNAVLSKDSNIFVNNSSNVESTVDCDFPDYVRSIKERECWLLFQKMSKKGVSVTYDTILRGMLTPTEFRHLQKQREIENGKAKELEEAEALASVENKILLLGKK